MSERRRGATEYGSDEPPRSKRLQALCAAAEPALQPYDKLRERVADLAARHAAPAPRPVWWLPVQKERKPAYAAACALLLLAFTGYRLVSSARDQRARSGRAGVAPLHRVHDGVKMPSTSPLASGEAPSGTAKADRREGVAPPPTPSILPSPGTPERPARNAPPQLPHFRHASDGLADLNGKPVDPAQRWGTLRANDWDVIEARLRHTVQIRDDFVQIPFPRLVAASDRQVVAAVESYKREAAVVDTRLAHKVTLAVKATALVDLCNQLKADSGIDLRAGPSVADEKVTVFCQKQPLRDVMRQLSRPFGYAWLRSGKEGAYRYELVQDLKSQLLEEELRNRDRHQALLALEQEIERYRPYLSLSPEEALTRSKTAAPAEKKLLEQLAGWGWGPVHMYFRLSPRELAALRAGQKLVFSTDRKLVFSPDLKQDRQPVPPDLASGVLQSVRDTRLIREGDDFRFSLMNDATFPTALPPTAVPEASPYVDLVLKQSELGQFTLDGMSGFSIPETKMFRGGGGGPYARAVSPAVIKPDNRTANAGLANDPTLRRRVSVQPRSSCGEGKPELAEPVLASRDHPAATADRQQPAGEKKVNSADVLEALYQATGMPIVADYYTHLHASTEFPGRDQSLFDLLNQFSDTLRMRWRKEGSWLQFRSTSYYDDRLKEVPNRHLHRWAAARQAQGVLTLDELLEIAQLSDTQLDGTGMAEGARECFGLLEWGIARDHFFRPHLRFLAQLTPAQRQEAQSEAGLAFTRMTLSQQQQFIAFVIDPEDDQPLGLSELVKASLRVQHTQPGWYRWERPEATSRLPGQRTIGLFPVRARTRSAALQAARRIDPLAAESQIMPTELAVTVVYISGSPRGGVTARVRRATPTNAAGWALSMPERPSRG